MVGLVCAVVFGVVWAVMSIVGGLLGSVVVALSVVFVVSAGSLLTSLLLSWS